MAKLTLWSAHILFFSPWLSRLSDSPDLDGSNKKRVKYKIVNINLSIIAMMDRKEN